MNNIENLYDVAIIGGGPAGLTAGIYLARARYRVIVIEKEHFGGQITITEEVVNYPAVKKASGKELTATMQKQAESFGAEFMLAEVLSLDMQNDIKTIKTSRGDIHCFGVLLATGAHPRMVGFEGEQEFKGRGVAYCATCDGEFFTGKDVFVIGGGFAAAEESVFLTKYARHVTILINTDGFTCAAATAEPALNHPKITVLTNVQVLSVTGDNGLKSITYENVKTQHKTTFTAKENETFGVFVFAGYEPATELISGIADLNEHGYVITDNAQKTTCEGLYAAGDVCIKPLRQVVTAVGDGALAATELERYVQTLQKKTGLHPKQKRINDNTEKTEQTDSNELFTGEMKAQLETVFSKMENRLKLELCLDDTKLSQELKEYISTLCDMTDKLTLVYSEKGNEHTPCVRILKENGQFTGLAFHGVPGGHEFTSFILGIYNASGKGQAIDQSTLIDIKSITKKLDLTILVSLSCTMCPELVVSAQRMATENTNITAEVYDINHFADLKEKYNVMSVPCLVVNHGEKVLFGKKNINQLLELII